ncbi:DUF2778 domain-containing protein [Trinickia diaoshuihuensis]|uniref:DUF2778 domain-containing protein n=1 Tax=Trinickia diaoshuihuensis TaxID=2292265 RepID=UPI000E26F03D|nr:DUF2778 domain-containing protein [Trinickia diaoshuihuensis]
MPIQCTFSLNGKETSLLSCPGVGAIAAFSGRGVGRDNPAAVAKEDVGPIPKGTYYIIDRQSGGRLGALRDFWNAYGVGTTDHKKWFMLWNSQTGDSTMVDGIKRGSFRLHPMGPMGLSEGCITVVNGDQFNRLADYLRSRAPDLPVPGSGFKAYGTVQVQ